MRKIFLFLPFVMGGLLLAGCGTRLDKYEKLYVAGKKVLLGDTGVPQLTRAQLDAEPQPSARVTVGGFQPLFLGATVSADSQVTYQSADKRLLQMEGGRIVKLVGFGGDVSLASRLKNDIIQMITPSPRELSEPLRMERSYDIWVKGQPRMLTFDCHLTSRRQETIEIMERFYDTQRYEEYCLERGGRRQLTGTFWLDKTTGFPWKTRQILPPDGVEITVEVTKPPFPVSPAP